MFGNHFYHATTRKAVALFGTLFNNISNIKFDVQNTNAYFDEINIFNQNQVHSEKQKMCISKCKCVFDIYRFVLINYI